MDDISKVLSDLGPLIGGAGALLSAVAAAVLALIKRQQTKTAKSTERIERELTVNGGSGTFLDQQQAFNRTQQHFNREVLKSLAYVNAGLRNFADVQRICKFRTNWRGENTDLNWYYARRTNYDRVNLLGMQWHMVIHPSDLGYYTQSFGGCLSTGSPFDEVVRIQTSDRREIIYAAAYGEPIWESIRLVPEEEQKPNRTYQDRDDGKYILDGFEGYWREITKEEYDERRAMDTVT